MEFVCFLFFDIWCFIFKNCITNNSFNLYHLKKTTLTYLFLFTLFFCRAQQNDVFINDFDKFSFEVSANLNLNSNSVTNEFVSAYLNGDYISDELKNRTIERLENENRIGYINNYKAYYFQKTKNLFGSSDCGFFVGIEYHNLLEVKFRKELFEIYFNGNSQFEGQRINLDDMKFNSLSFQQLKLGLFRNINVMSGKSTVGLSLAFNKGQNNFFADIENASFYTHTNGEQLELEIKTDVQHSDTLKSDLWAFNGVGTSLDFFYVYVNPNGNNLIFEINNFGFISWNNNSFSFSKDTLYNYSGYNIENIFNVEGEIFQQTSTDTLVDEFAYNSENNNYFSFLPMLMQLSYSQNLIKDKLTITGLFNHYFFTEYKPFILLKPNYYFNKNIRVSPLLSYGGYGKFNAGLEVSFNIAKSFLLVAGTNFLNSYIYPENLSGQGAYFSLSKKF